MRLKENHSIGSAEPLILFAALGNGEGLSRDGDGTGSGGSRITANRITDHASAGTGATEKERYPVCVTCCSPGTAGACRYFYPAKSTRTVKIPRGRTDGVGAGGIAYCG